MGWLTTHFPGRNFIPKEMGMCGRWCLRVGVWRTALRKVQSKPGEEWAAGDEEVMV